MENQNQNQNTRKEKKRPILTLNNREFIPSE